MGLLRLGIRQIGVGVSNNVDTKGRIKCDFSDQDRYGG